MFTWSKWLLVCTFYCVWRCSKLWVWTWTWSSALELRKYEFEFVYVIVVIFGINNGYMMLMIILNQLKWFGYTLEMGLG